MKLLLIRSASCSGHSYMVQCLHYMTGIEPTVVHIDSCHTIDYGEYDYLIYNAFSNESYAPKFDTKIIYPADERFHAFKGKKILFDTHDEGNKDGFERMKDYGYPRLKINPGYDFMTKFDVVAAIPFTAYHRFFLKFPAPKTIPLLYCVNCRGITFPPDIRPMVFERLKPFNPYTTRTSMNYYADMLKTAKISVTVPGYGTGCKSHVEALAARTLLFAYDSISMVKTLPFADLVDGKHYISFNLDNLEEKLSLCLSDDKLVEEVSREGHLCLRLGYDPRRTGEEIARWFNS